MASENSLLSLPLRYLFITDLWKGKKKKKHRSDSKRKTHMCTRTPTCSKAVFLSTSGLQEEASWIDWEIMKEGRERGIDAAGPRWQEQTTRGWVRHLHTKPGRIQNPSRSGRVFCFHVLSLNKYLLIISLAADIHPAVVKFFTFSHFDTQRKPDLAFEEACAPWNTKLLKWQTV